MADGEQFSNGIVSVSKKMEIDDNDYDDYRVVDNGIGIDKPQLKTRSIH